MLNVMRPAIFAIATATLTILVWHADAAFIGVSRVDSRACHYHYGNPIATATAMFAMKDLPEDVVKYSQVPKNGVFSAAGDNIPKGLLKNHSTKDGTWGIIKVTQGKLGYQINGKNNDETPAEIFELDPETPGIIEPTVFHEVAPLTDNVEFVVQFLRLPDTGPVDEQREGL
ncbi:Domain of unknown function (DUF1971) [Seminavis robusta]|uniref:TehB/YeaR-like domain-containing protein n=1 Tax=Seminavis robusta TaxID=568900 RepID=A0A9N8DX32_9STRA|nr:Domain of unknown function (DUF1971) [Seminavis robusta]|eukprot:Sro433_g141900.1 Domain of unknown function (DUF1971) (172) ;mRNA; f:55971-56486